jgi:hypothetical protein
MVSTFAADVVSRVAFPRSMRDWDNVVDVLSCLLTRERAQVSAVSGDVVDVLEPCSVVFSHTEMWLRLWLVNGVRCQSFQRPRKVIPASWAMRSSSAAQRYRCGDEKVLSSSSTIQ